MGQAGVPIAYTRTTQDQRRTGPLQPRVPTDLLNDSLGCIWVLGLDPLERELKPHLNNVLAAIQERNNGAAEQVVRSGILPVLVLSLQSRGPLTLLTAKLVAELAKEPVVRGGFGEAGLVSALLSVLTSTDDQELLLLVTQAISRVSYNCATHQELLLRLGAVPRLISVLLRWPGGALEASCLLALCNLSDMGEAVEACLLWEKGPILRPEERVYRGSLPRHHRGGFASSSVTLVRVARRGPGQYTCSVEVFRRCSASFWNLHGSRRSPLSHSPLSALAGCSRWYESLWLRPRAQSLKTRVFHTFL
ncbi:hypothetical protein NHX12_024465 [Muraenolepis orangiensis]|uniref:Ig-like domain-containing protein n=1 Tax=Muraenolepis orangiensis TaxID=630683 RepID=A0A9Q0EHJ0_9TELE|nr:hypothetical protein NHX12_024465 [Muraenolepis orangiensis]